MAVIQSQQYNLLIDLKDSTGGSLTWRIDEPRQSGLTLSDVVDAFEPVFAGTSQTGQNLLCNSSGYSIIAVESARTELINKTITDLQ